MRQTDTIEGNLPIVQTVCKKINKSVLDRLVGSGRSAVRGNISCYGDNCISGTKKMHCATWGNFYAEDKQEAGENAESRLTESQHAAENKEKSETKRERDREEWVKENFLCKGKAHHVFAHIKYERDYAL